MFSRTVIVDNSRRL